MHVFHFNLVLCGALLGAAIVPNGIGALGVVFATLNLAAYFRGIQYG